jgi:hypothetical protein
LLEQLAQFAHTTGDILKAKFLYQESIIRFRELNDMWHLSRTLVQLGKFEREVGDELRAKDRIYPNTLEAMGWIACMLAKDEGEPLVLALVYHIQQHPAASKEVKARAEQLRADLEAGMSPEQVAAIANQPGQGTFEIVVKEILRRLRLSI